MFPFQGGGGGGVGGNKFVVQMFLMPRGMNDSKIQISYH